MKNFIPAFSYDEPANSIKVCIEKIKKGFQDDLYQNETSISRQVVEPILRKLAWPTDNAGVVCYEYPLQGKKADIALLHKGKPTVIIEVKRLGAAGGAEKQLFEYVFYAGVSLAVLTTGKEWEFYLPLKPGDYQDRQVYKLDICARETEESVNRLMRYLFYPHLCSGQAIKAAEADHGDKARAKDIQDALPTAWAQMLSECDARLMELLQDKVGDICGFTPDADVVKKFIGQQVGNIMPYQPQTRPAPVGMAHTKPIEAKKKPKKLVGFELHGAIHEARNGADTLFVVYEALIRRDASFPDKFMQSVPGGKKIRQMAHEQRDLYDNPVPYEGSSRQLSTGHWINTHGSRKNIEEIIQVACKVAGIDFQRDLKLLYK